MIVLHCEGQSQIVDLHKLLDRQKNRLSNRRDEGNFARHSKGTKHCETAIGHKELVEGHAFKWHIKTQSVHKQCAHKEAFLSAKSTSPKSWPEMLHHWSAKPTSTSTLSSHLHSLLPFRQRPGNDLNNRIPSIANSQQQGLCRSKHKAMLVWLRVGWESA